MLDGEQAARAQPAAGVADNGGYQRHAIRAAEHRMMRIMLGYFGFQNVHRRERTAGSPRPDRPVRLVR